MKKNKCETEFSIDNQSIIWNYVYKTIHWGTDFVWHFNANINDVQPTTHEHSIKTTFSIYYFSLIYQLFIFITKDCIIIQSDAKFFPMNISETTKKKLSAIESGWR